MLLLLQQHHHQQHIWNYVYKFLYFKKMTISITINASCPAIPCQIVHLELLLYREMEDISGAEDAMRQMGMAMGSRDCLLLHISFWFYAWSECRVWDMGYVGEWKVFNHWRIIIWFWIKWKGQLCVREMRHNDIVVVQGNLWTSASRTLILQQLLRLRWKVLSTLVVWASELWKCNSICLCLPSRIQAATCVNASYTRCSRNWIAYTPRVTYEQTRTNIKTRERWHWKCNSSAD